MTYEEKIQAVTSQILRGSYDEPKERAKDILKSIGITPEYVLCPKCRRVCDCAENDGLKS